MEAIVQFDHDRSLQQTLDHFRRAWERHGRRMRMQRIRGLVILLGLLLSILLNREIDWRGELIFGIALAAWLCYPWMKFQRGIRILKRHHAQTPVPEVEIRIGFNEQMLYIDWGEKRNEHPWTTLQRYDLNANVLKLEFENEPWPMIMEPNEVTPEFFWSLVAKLKEIGVKSLNEEIA